MADRYDPKLSTRPQAERRQADQRRGQGGDDDPLIELARIVSGKGGFDAPPVRAERRAEAPRAPLPSDAEIAHDLESELLSELQASFSMLQEPLAAASAAPPAPAPTPAPAPPPQQTAKIIPAPVARMRQAPVEPPPAAPPPPAPPVQRAQPVAPARPVRQAPPPAERAAPAPVRPANDADFSNLQFRPTQAPPAPRARAPEPPPRAATSRWEPRQDARSEANRYAPPRPAARQPAPEPRMPEPRLADEYQDQTYDEPLSFDEEAYYDDNPENFDLVPGYGDEDLLPPFPEEDMAALKPRRSGRAVGLIAGILAVVVAGGAAAIMLRSTSTGVGAPPIIAADPTPTKVAPETGKPVDDQSQAKLIYDRVNPGEEADSSQLAEQDTDPVSNVATSDDTDNPISRVILPGGPGVDRPADASAPETATADDAAREMASGDTSDGAIQPIGPKKVRTVVVRPDGTILSSEAAPAEGSAPATAGAASEPLPTGSDATEPSAPVAAAPQTVVPPPPSSGSDIAELETAAREGGDIAAAEAGQPAAADAASEPADEPLPEPAAEAPAPEPVAAPERKVASATPRNSDPIDLTARSAPAAAGSGMLVQISSQRSEEAAQSTFRDLQKRFPGILGSYEANIQRADLGAKGVYYRVRVGPFAASDADKLCTALKGAGGDCILAAR